MINDIGLHMQQQNSNESAPTSSPGKDEVCNKTSYFGFKMTMSNSRLTQNNNEDSEYSMADSPLLTEQKNDLNLQIQLQNSDEITNGSNYIDSSKNIDHVLKQNKTITNEVEDSTTSAPMPLMNKLKIPAQQIIFSQRNHNEQIKQKLSSTLVCQTGKDNNSQKGESRLSQQSRGSQRSNKTLATSQATSNQREIESAIRVQSKIKSFRKPKIIGSNQVTTLVKNNKPSNLSNMSGISCGFTNNVQTIQLSQNSKSGNQQSGNDGEQNKINQYEYKLADCKNENIEEYIEAYQASALTPATIHSDPQHSDLFIQGNSVTAEQIEYLDQNLTQMSLCQNLDIKQEGDYMLDDDSKLQVQRNSKFELDNEVGRLDQMSPDQQNLTKNEWKNDKRRNQAQFEQMDQIFKIDEQLKNELKNKPAQQKKEEGQFNFTFNQDMNPSSKNLELRESRSNPLSKEEKKRNVSRNNMNKIELFSPQRQNTEKEFCDQKGQIVYSKSSQPSTKTSTRNTQRQLPNTKGISQSVKGGMPPSGRSYRAPAQFQIPQLGTFDDAQSVDENFKRQIIDIEKQYAMFQGKTKKISLSGLNQNYSKKNKPQTVQNSAAKDMNFQETTQQSNKIFNEVKFSNNFIKPKRISMSPDKKMLQGNNAPQFEMGLNSMAYQQNQQSLKLPSINPMANQHNQTGQMVNLPQIFNSPGRDGYDPNEIINNHQEQPGVMSYTRTRRIGNRAAVQRNMYQHNVNKMSIQENHQQLEIQGPPFQTQEMIHPPSSAADFSQQGSNRYRSIIQMQQLIQGPMSEQKQRNQYVTNEQTLPINPREYMSPGRQLNQGENSMIQYKMQKHQRQMNQSMGAGEICDPNDGRYESPSPNLSMITDQVINGGQSVLEIQAMQNRQVLSDDGDRQTEGVVINNHHRDIKSSSKLPQAFRIFRSTQARNVKRNQKYLNDQSDMTSHSTHHHYNQQQQ